ncbi:hypothetical protein [Sphingomonas sp. 3-13AW]|uniref:hypothetical protein n=1 Tax=Sphingomonas sp. 3-13AW TaxID=3050450 RepID=UPI003BB4C1D3
MTPTIVSPNKGFPLLDSRDFGRAETVNVEVILTFEHGQEFYDVDVIVDATATDFDTVEIDVIAQILEASGRDLSDLAKISLCYMIGEARLGQDAPLNAIVDHLIRFSAKYYFQPDQRDPHEQALVDALGIASATANLKVA